LGRKKNPARGRVGLKQKKKFKMETKGRLERGEPEFRKKEERGGTTHSEGMYLV